MEGKEVTWQILLLGEALGRLVSWVSFLTKLVSCRKSEIDWGELQRKVKREVVYKEIETSEDIIKDSFVKLQCWGWHWHKQNKH